MIINIDAGDKSPSQIKAQSTRNDLAKESSPPIFHWFNLIRVDFFNKCINLTNSQKLLKYNLNGNLF